MSDDNFTRAYLENYIRVCMRVAFARAGRGDVDVTVVHDDARERWIVTTPTDTFVCAYGSDDDQFTFTNSSDTYAISFPLPADLCPNCGLNFDAMSSAQRSLHSWFGEILITPCRHT